MSEVHLFVIDILLAWLAGIRVYLTVFGVGLAGLLGWIDLPPALHPAQSWSVLGASGALAVAEFFADKIPGVDSGWDLLQTLARVPAGAFLAAAMLSPDGNLGGSYPGGRRRRGTHQPHAQGRYARVTQHLTRADEQLDRLTGRRHDHHHGIGIGAGASLASTEYGSGFQSVDGAGGVLALAITLAASASAGRADTLYCSARCTQPPAIVKFIA